MTTTWTAPGRVNLIGEHVDYNDGPVLPFALKFSTTARVGLGTDKIVRVESKDVGSEEFPVDTAPGEVDGWAAYVAGVVWALRGRGVDVPGATIELRSDIPVGAGLSSSAALACSVASAIADECGAHLSPHDVADAARRAENDYVGASTGVMDQLASMLSVANHAVLIDCRTLETRDVAFDPSAEGLRLLLIDTHARHSLVTSGYGERRRDCEQAARTLGIRALRDADLDMVASLDDERLRARAHHVVTEIARVEEVVALLDAGHVSDIGAWLTASHRSLQDAFEVSCDELDVAVEAALSAGALGARMTGGGFGGCVIALVRSADASAVEAAISQAYRAHDWDAPTVWSVTPCRGAHRE